MIWFTSDTHFGHENVLRFAERPWNNIDAMNRGIVANINSRVLPDDHLYILGDYSFKLHMPEAAALRQSIRCKNVHLVPGNHDKDWTVQGFSNYFIVEPPICKVTYKEHGFICSHYPMADWQGMNWGSIHLHGHIHSRGLEYNLFNQAQGLYRYDVGCDANNYTPVSADEIIGWFDSVECCNRVNWKNWVNATRNKVIDSELLELLDPEERLGLSRRYRKFINLHLRQTGLTIAQIIVFGGRARGDYSLGDDVDIYLVLEGAEADGSVSVAEALATANEALQGLEIGANVYCGYENEFELLSAQPGTVESTVVHEGAVIYEAED